MTDQEGSAGTVLVVGAHPDDETLGCGGTIARRLDEGCKVIVVVLTGGAKFVEAALGITSDPSPEEVAELRRQETARATGILGVPGLNLHFMDYDDGLLESQADAAVESLLPLLREHHPAEVFHMNPYEHHPDHVASCGIVRRACADAGIEPRMWQYIVSLRYGLSLEDVPGGVERIDTSRYRSLKARALLEFQSHRGIFRDKQGKPLVADFDRYATDEELFVVGG
jgi:LmbE family N-acetylglucosaminyl deacetylase